jgi:4-amino-4-deoxy-L-arabinose transferase-like glycosyltransferase
MWLGMVGIQVQMWLRPFSQQTYTWITHLAWYEPTNYAALSQLAQFLTAARLAVIIANSMGLVIIFLLARRLIGRLPSFLLITTLALDPFIVGLSSLLHVDALMTTFATISLLALLWMVKGKGRFSPLIAGSTAALALLTKSPATLLIPFTGLMVLLSLWHHWHNQSPETERLNHLKPPLFWLIAFIVTALLTLPALWTSPAALVNSLGNEAGRHIDSALRPTFFLGQMGYDHGWLFYPIALLWRLNPIILMGLVLALIFAVRLWLQQRQPLKIRQFAQNKQWLAFIFLLWSFLFIMGISIAAKKFDRYLLPAIPALAIVSALAWTRLAAQRRWLLPALLGIQVVYLLTAVPHPLTVYNPLVGGSFTAAKVLTVGWGEGISAAGQWLSENVETKGKTAVTSLPPALTPFFTGQVRDQEDVAQADYTIFTASSAQANPKAIVEAEQQYQLLHTIHFNGLDQAWIFEQTDVIQPTPITDFSAPFSFDQRVQLLAASASFEQNAIQFRARWRLLQNGRYALRLTLRDDTHTWAEFNTPLLNETTFYPEHWPRPETAVIPYTITPPPAIPPGRYYIDLSLFDEATQAQLPLLTADNAFRGLIYSSNAVTIPPPTVLALVSEMDIGQPINHSWLEGALILWGYQPLPADLLSGSRTTLDLYWQATQPLPPDLQISLQWGDEPAAIIPLSRYPTQQWRMGEPIHEKYELDIPTDMPAGDYALHIHPRIPDASVVTLAPIHITATDRLFQLPDDIVTPLDYQLGADIHLRGITIAANGDTLQFTLYWQTTQQPTADYTAFVHVLDANGRIITQTDHPPANQLTTTWAAGEVIIDEYTINLPADTSPPYQLAIGLYTPADGVRLPIVHGDSDDDGDRIILPLSDE